MNHFVRYDLDNEPVGRWETPDGVIEANHRGVWAGAIPTPMKDPVAYADALKAAHVFHLEHVKDN